MTKFYVYIFKTKKKKTKNNIGRVVLTYFMKYVVRGPQSYRILGLKNAYRRHKLFYDICKSKTI